MRRTIASTMLRGSSRRCTQIAPDRGAFVVGERMALDDRLHQRLFAAEVVLDGRGVALTGEHVDLAGSGRRCRSAEHVLRPARRSRSRVPRRLVPFDQPTVAGTPAPDSADV